GLGELDRCVGSAEPGPALRHPTGQRFGHGREGVAMDQAETIVVEVYIAVAVHVPEIGPLPARLDDGVGWVIAEVAAESAGKALLGARNQGGRPPRARRIGLPDAIDSHAPPGLLLPPPRWPAPPISPASRRFSALSSLQPLRRSRAWHRPIGLRPARSRSPAPPPR